MSAPPASPPTNDAEHLKLLALFHWIAGGFLAAVTLFNLIDVLQMHAGQRDAAAHVRASGFPVADFGFNIWMFVALAFYAIPAGCLLTAARLIQRRHGYRFLFILACIECLGFPFGTVLGVFTIIVLLRPSVKQLFGGNVKL